MSRPMKRTSAHSPTSGQDLYLWLFLFFTLGPLGGSSGARLRCGSELIEALEFVCGDRGVYLGKRGYGPRSRGRGIVDQCCLGPGCDLHHLEKYCAKSRGPRTTQEPTQEPTTEQQFQNLLKIKLLDTLKRDEGPGRRGEITESPRTEEGHGRREEGPGRREEAPETREEVPQRHHRRGPVHSHHRRRGAKHTAAS